nr:hypothetical protein [Tanacetum cinerariifolium]
ALDSKLLSINSINSQHLDKKEQEVKNVVEQPAERRNHAENITPETESDEVTEFNAENLLPIPSKCEVTLKDEIECDMPAKYVCSLVFTTFSNPLFKDDDDLDSIEELKIYSNPLCDEDEINSDKLDPHCFNVEYDFVESLLNRDTFIDFSSKFDFSGELAHIEPEIPKSDFDFEEEIRLIENLLYDFPRPSKELNAEIADTIIESIPLLPILVQDGNSQQEEIDIVTKTDDVLPPSDDNDDDLSDDLLLGEADLFLSDNSIPPGIENFTDDQKEIFDNPSNLRPPPEPPDDNFDLEPEVFSAVMEDIDEPDEHFNPGGEIIISTNNKDVDYFPFMFVIRIFLPYFIFPEISSLLLSAESEDTIFYPEISYEVFLANHSIQNKESFENLSNEIAVSNPNEEKEEPPQDSDIHQLIEKCSTEDGEKQSMEDAMLELVKICQEKEFLCIHDNVDDLIESALNYKLLLMNSQHLDKKEQEVKNVVEQPVERRNRSIQSLQNFKVVHKNSTSQISSIHAVATILSTKEPEHSLTMGIEEENGVEEENVVQQEEEEIDLEDISQIQDVVLREKLLSITRLISNIESLNDNSNPDRVFNSFESDNFLLDNFSPEFETFFDHSKETRSGNTTHADNSLPEYDSFRFEIEPDQEKLIYLVKSNIPDNSSNDFLLEETDLFLSDNSIPPGIENVADDPEGDIRFLEELLIDDSILSHESSDSNLEDNPSIPRPPPEPPDAETDTGEEIPVVMNEKMKMLIYLLSYLLSLLRCFLYSPLRVRILSLILVSSIRSNDFSLG